MPESAASAERRFVSLPSIAYRLTQAAAGDGVARFPGSGARAHRRCEARSEDRVAAFATAMQEREFAISHQGVKKALTRWAHEETC